METMAVVNKILNSFGATDTALLVMGPTLTILIAWAAGIAVGQGVKWPLSLVVKGDAHGYLVRVCAVFATFSAAHYLSNHLTVPLEVVVAIFQPLVYLGLKLATGKWAPWASPLFASVGKAT